MYHPEVVGKPRTRQRQLLFSTFGASAHRTWTAVWYRCSSLSIPPPQPPSLMSLGPFPVVSCPIPVDQRAVAKPRWSALHPLPWVRPCRYHTRTRSHEHPAPRTCPALAPQERPHPGGCVTWPLRTTAAVLHGGGGGHHPPHSSSRAGDVEPKVNPTLVPNYIGSLLATHLSKTSLG